MILYYICHCQIYKILNGLTCIKFGDYFAFKNQKRLSIYPVLAKMYSSILILSMLPLYGIIYHSMIFNHIPLVHSNYTVNQFFHPPTIHNSIMLLIHDIHKHNPVISSHITLYVFMCMCLLLGSKEIGRMPPV